MSGNISDISSEIDEKKSNYSADSGEDPILFGIENVVNPEKIKTTPKSRKETKDTFKKDGDGDDDNTDEEMETLSPKKSKSNKNYDGDDEDDDEVPTVNEKQDMDTSQDRQRDVDEASNRPQSGDERTKMDEDEKSSTRSRRSANYQDYSFFKNRPKVPRTEDDFKQKTELLSEWEELVRKSNERHVKKLDLDSHIDEIRYEIEKHKYRRRKENAVKMMGKATYFLAKFIEWGAGEIHLFDINLEGWSNSVNYNLSDYDDVFTELYEKYKGAGSGAPPELRFLTIFTFSAIEFIFLNHAPKLLSNMLNKSKKEEEPGENSKTKKKARRPTTPAKYRKMTPPNIDDLEDDPEIQELLFDLGK